MATSNDSAQVAATKLAERLAGLLPDGVASAAGPCLDSPMRHGEESRLIAKAVDKRRREFATGRRLAHLLLDDFGVADQPLLPGERRAPQWPTGIVGSISHTRQRCVAAVARTPHWRFVGLDLEEPTPLERDLWRRIVDPVEQAWLESLPAERRGLLAKLVFSTKECVYKALAPVVPRVLEFGEVRVGLDEQGARFSVLRLPEDVPVDPCLLHGRYHLDEQDLLTVLTVPAPAGG